MSTETNFCPDDCYWKSQGTCFLETLVERLIIDFLLASPKASEDLVRCVVGLQCCVAPSPEIIDLAQSGVHNIGRLEAEDARQHRAITPYRDNLQHIGPGVFKPSEDNE